MSYVAITNTVCFLALPALSLWERETQQRMDAPRFAHAVV